MYCLFHYIVQDQCQADKPVTIQIILFSLLMIWYSSCLVHSDSPCQGRAVCHKRGCCNYTCDQLTDSLRTQVKGSRYIQTKSLKTLLLEKKAQYKVEMSREDWPAPRTWWFLLK